MPIARLALACMAVLLAACGDAVPGPRSPTETGVYLHVLPGRPREAVDRLAGNAEDLPW